MKNIDISAKIYLLLVLTLALTCCGQKKENPTTALFEETMDLHDVAMVKMGEIYKLKKTLSRKKDSLLQVKPADSVTQKKIQLLIEQLDAADEAMMSWMAQFETKFKNEESEESLNYYRDQKGKIRAVADSMDEAIKKAREFTD